MTTHPSRVLPSVLLILALLLPAPRFAHAAVILSAAGLSPGTTVLDFEALPVSPLPNPSTIGGVTFSSTIGLGIDDVSPFCTFCTEVFRHALLPRPSIFGGSYGVLTMEFATPVREVGFGIWDPNEPGNRVEIFDSDMNLLEFFVITDTGPPGGAFDTFLGFVRPGADIAKVVYTPAVPGDFYAIDNIRFHVPEPATLLLLGATLPAAGLRRRRRG